MSCLTGMTCHHSPDCPDVYCPGRPATKVRKEPLKEAEAPKRADDNTFSFGNSLLAAVAMVAAAFVVAELLIAVCATAGRL